MSGAGKMHLILGSHAHVPHGAAEEEFECAYVNILRPFVTNLCKYPKIQAALHYSGTFLHWVERSHPEVFLLIEDMVSRRQAELLGGGFYEPALSLIPLQDKIGQIELLTTYLRKNFGKRPQGCWIPAFAWEQNLVSPLAACGMSYAFLSENQFIQAGMDGDDLFCPCLCEDQGKLLAVFPVSLSSGAALGEKSVSSVLEELDSRRVEGREMAVSIFPEKLRADPVEAPDYTWNRFFDEISLCEPFAESVIPARLLKNLKELKKVCISDSQDARSAASSAAGGVAPGANSSPRQFLIEHPEANGIYSKMIFTGLLVNQLRGDKSRKLNAREEVWKAQGCGLFSSAGKQGLYRHHLRNAAYSALIAAERISREKGKSASSLVPYDFNLDGEDEYLFQDARINCYVQCAGGGIFELDYLPGTWNYLDTCGGRLAFADRLLPPDTRIEELSCGPAAGARMCRNERYALAALDRTRRKLRLKLGAAAHLPFGAAEIEKTFSLKKDAVTVEYVIANSGAAQETFLFAPEIDLSFPGEGGAFTRFFSCKAGAKDAPLSDSALRDADSIKIHDLKNEIQIHLCASRAFDARIAAVRIHSAERESLYQAACIMPVFALSLESGGSWNCEFSLRFSH